MIARITFMLLAVSGLWGCGRPPAQELAAEKLRAAVAAETGDTNTLLFIEEGRMRIRSGDQSITVNQTESTQRPPELPADMRLPADARYDLWTEGPRGCTLSLLTGLASVRLVEFFREQWAACGWQAAAEVQTDTLQGLTFQKNGHQVAITIEPETEEPGTTRAMLFIETLPTN